MSVEIFYYKSKENNFGDVLNPWFWNNFFNDIGLYSGDSNSGSSLIVGIGTLLNNNLPKNRMKHILGSGAGYGNHIPKIDDSWRVRWVRGPLTAKAIGVDEKKSIADPALMIRDFLSVLPKKDYDFSFMPHVGIDSNLLKITIEECGINYISPRWERDVVISHIAKSENLICSAMHGAIVADSLRVPWLPVVTSDEIFPFKWKDWCASVELDYKPILLPTIWGIEPSGFTASIKFGLKKKILNDKLKVIKNNKGFILSNDLLCERKIQLMRNEIDLFSQELSTSVV